MVSTWAYLRLEDDHAFYMLKTDSQLGPAEVW